MQTSSRTLSIHSPAIPQIDDPSALIPVRLSGTEAINHLFEYQLLLKTPDALNPFAGDAANVALDDLIGQEMTVMVQLDGSGTFVAGAMGQTGAAHVGAGMREITALISHAQFVRQEGRHVLYQLTLRPWLHLATLTTDCKIFQDQTVVELLDTLLADYHFPVKKRLIETYPKRDYQTQYNETDFDFFCRLCQEWGISWFFEHSDGAQRLVLIDNMGSYAAHPSSAYHTLRYHSGSARIDEEVIRQLTLHTRLTTGQYSTTDYDYTRPRANLHVTRSDPRATAHAKSEQYQWHTDSHYAQPNAGSAEPNAPREEGDFIARLRMEALRSPGRRAFGQGNLRGMVPGHRFRLTQHPADAANTDYLVLATQLTITDVDQETQANQATSSTSSTSNITPITTSTNSETTTSSALPPARTQQYRVDLSFEAHPMNEVYRPERITPKPRMSMTTAVVVGPPDQSIWTDQLGRIKVQFPWDRLGQHNQHSSCWLRTTSTWAGNQLGSIALPRIGQEVLVSFMENDPDLPICTGRVYNQSNLPPWNLPSQQALSGMRSRELTPNGGNSASGRSNHLIMDDSPGQIQTQLKSDHLDSQLSLGHITRIDDNAGRTDPRGQGFELRTDGHGAVRAGKGLLITTEARPNAHNHITDMDETIDRLQQAQQQQEELTDLARQYSAHLSQQTPNAVHQTLKQDNSAIQGTPSHEPTVFPELNEPHLVLSGAAGIAFSTPQSTHISSGEHMALTSGKDISIAVGKSLFVTVKEGLSVFVHKLGIRLVAASGHVTIEAQNDAMLLEAAKDFNITSTADTIHITAKNKVLVNGGGSFTEWSANGIKSGTNGTWTEHAAAHTSLGPLSRPLELPEFPRKSISPKQIRQRVGLSK